MSGLCLLLVLLVCRQATLECHFRALCALRIVSTMPPVDHPESLHVPMLSIVHKKRKILSHEFWTTRDAARQPGSVQQRWLSASLQQPRSGSGLVAL